ncbi:DUF4355 domain-containing protein, partial [Aerococcus urinaeequi]
MNIEKQPLVPFNLQFFAENDATTENDTGNEAADATETKTETPATFTQSQLDSEVNRAVQKALAKQQADFEAQKEEIAKNAIEKEKDYAQLSEEERRQRELDDERADFEKERAEFKREKLVSEIKADLADKGLPTEYAELLAVEGSAEKAVERAGNLQERFNEAVAKEVRIQLAQTTPGFGATKAETASNIGADLGKQHGKRNGTIF